MTGTVEVEEAPIDSVVEVDGVAGGILIAVLVEVVVA